MIKIKKSDYKTKKLLKKSEIEEDFYFKEPIFEDMTEIIPKSLLKGSIFLGNLLAAIDINILKKNNIQAVLTMFDHFIDYSKTNIEQKIISAEDNINYDISLDFENAFDFIEKNRKLKKNVLIHCKAGVSRSAAIIIAYIMKIEKKSLNATLKFVKKSRNQIFPNQGFIKILEKYEKIILNKK